ncbi:MAG: chorismate lyase [Marinobacter sp.]|nr:chorismate lyase [Marinobacter sp.]
MPLKGSDTSGRDTASLIPPTRWYPNRVRASLRRGAPLGAARHWLQLEGSLTRALQMRCDRFSVQVLAEGFRCPTLEESRTLNIRLRQRAWIREVCLQGDGEPWVLARTVIPLRTLQGPGRRLRHLGRKPLGAYLFSHTQWQRGPFQTGLCRAQQAGAPTLARRSSFCNGKRCLLVGEYFLPALLQQ